jgi:hypothetical protein
MTLFGGLANPPALNQGESYQVWNNEAVGAGTTGQEVALAIIPGATGQSVSVEVSFSADPGAFELDLLTADTDKAVNFIQRGSINAVNAAFAARLEASGIVANFAALKLVSITNAVNITAKISLK